MTTWLSWTQRVFVHQNIKVIHGCAKRANKIATLSILPSDAVILVIKGENDNVLKEILPIVALA